MSKPIDKEAAREAFLDQVRAYVDYWAHPDVQRDNVKERLSGLAFSILNIFDGTSAMMPAFDIVVRPHPDDKAYQQAEGEDYYVDGMVINDDCHLHELFYRPSQRT